MRAALAAALALFLALLALAPHVHAGAHGTEECATCVVRGAEAAEDQTPEVAPCQLPAGEVQPEPAQAPACGAPLGAVPGQSPPSASR